MSPNPESLFHVDLTLRDLLAQYPSARWLLEWFGLSPEESELDETLLAYCGHNRLDYWSLTADLIDPGDCMDDPDLEETEEVPAALARAVTPL